MASAMKIFLMVFSFLENVSEVKRSDEPQEMEHAATEEQAQY